MTSRTYKDKCFCGAVEVNARLRAAITPEGSYRAHARAPAGAE